MAVITTGMHTIECQPWPAGRAYPCSTGAWSVIDAPALVPTPRTHRDGLRYAEPCHSSFSDRHGLGTTPLLYSAALYRTRTFRRMRRTIHGASLLDYAGKSGSARKSADSTIISFGPAMFRA